MNQLPDRIKLLEENRTRLGLQCEITAKLDQDCL